MDSGHSLLCYSRAGTNDSRCCRRGRAPVARGGAFVARALKLLGHACKRKKQTEALSTPTAPAGRQQKEGGALPSAEMFATPSRHAAISPTRHRAAPVLQARTPRTSAAGRPAREVSIAAVDKYMHAIGLPHSREFLDRQSRARRARERQREAMAQLRAANRVHSAPSSPRASQASQQPHSPSWPAAKVEPLPVAWASDVGWSEDVASWRHVGEHPAAAQAHAADAAPHLLALDAASRRRAAAQVIRRPSTAESSSSTEDGRPPDTTASGVGDTGGPVSTVVHAGASPTASPRARAAHRVEHRTAPLLLGTTTLIDQAADGRWQSQSVGPITERVRREEQARRVPPLDDWMAQRWRRRPKLERKLTESVYSAVRTIIEDSATA